MDMLWIMPGNPRKWSPWKWERKTRETCMKLRRLCMNCRCVPSPQSNSTISGPRFTATALTFRFGVGHEAESAKTAHQSLFRRHRAFANEALHANLAAGGESAATGTRRRSHPGRDLGGSVAPWRFRDGSRGSFPWHGETVSGREAP